MKNAQKAEPFSTVSENIQKIATFQISKQYQKIIGEDRNQKAAIAFRKV
jgi:hypothetical protein